MKSQQIHQPRLSAGHTNKRHWQWLGIGGIVSIAVATIVFYAAPVHNTQLQSTQPSVPVPAVAALDPATQGLNGYLRAHANIDQAQAIDPATQSVLDYLRAHSR